jgi:hypothetical protein
VHRARQTAGSEADLGARPRTQLSRNQRPVAGPEKDGDGVGRKEAIADFDLPVQLVQEIGEPLEVLPGRIRDQIDVLGASYVAPCPNGQTANQDKANLCPDQALEQLMQPKGFDGQALRALPAKVERNSLSAMVSAKLTERVRLPSSLSRLFRTCSFERQGSFFIPPSGFTGFSLACRTSGNVE